MPDSWRASLTADPIPWLLDQTSSRPPFDPGSPDQPNKWVTLKTLKALRLLVGSKRT